LRKSYVFVDYIECRLVNQTNIQTFLSAPQNSVPRSVQHLAERHNVSSIALDNNLVLARHELIIVTEEPGLSILLEDVRNLGTCREAIAQSILASRA
jgi:hypothetical protein